MCWRFWGRNVVRELRFWGRVSWGGEGRGERGEGRGERGGRGLL